MKTYISNTIEETHNIAKKVVYSLNTNIIILSGVTEGQSIVTEGAFLLIDGSLVKDSE